MLAAAGVRSGASVVIGDPAAPYGALAAHSVHPGAVGPEHVMFLQAVANVLDSAVARLRAEEEIAEQAAARGRLVAQALDAEERTRREISEMLHDGPLQDLLALNQELLRLDGRRRAPRARAGRHRPRDRRRCARSWSTCTRSPSRSPGWSRRSAPSPTSRPATAPSPAS